MKIKEYTNKYPAAVVACLLLVSQYTPSHAQSSWTLKKEGDGMKIYTGPAERSNFKALKVEYTTKGTPSQLLALLMDMNAQQEWVYSTKKTEMLHKTSDADFITWSEKRLPTPFSNRDVVTHVTTSQDHTSRVMTIVATSEANYIPEKNNLVRVPAAKAVWTVTPVGNSINIVYVAEADPGGSIPAWVVNMFLTKGPYETFKKLGEVLQRPQYKNVRFSFIKD